MFPTDGQTDGRTKCIPIIPSLLRGGGLKIALMLQAVTYPCILNTSVNLWLWKVSHKPQYSDPDGQSC